MSEIPHHPAPKTRPPLTDSPWLWLALFSGMSLVALVVINHKHTLRQTRLEQRYANRVQAQVARNAARQAKAPAQNADNAPKQIEAEYRDQPEGTSMLAARPRSSLLPLMIGSGVVLAVALIGLWRQRMPK